MRRYVAVLLLASGCSIAFQSKPSRTSQAHTDCSTSRVLPIVDTLGTVAAVAASIYGFSRSDKTGDAIGGAAGLTSIFYLASAKNGFDDAAQCRSGEPAATTAQR
jgi:hypothetical protein